MNITNELKKVAKLYPAKTAIKFPIRKSAGKYSYDELSFKQLDLMVDIYAASFEDMGIKKGAKTILFVKPCLEFTALVFALFKVGAIPVLIDPGMGRKNLLAAVKSVKPEAMVAVPIVHLLRIFFWRPFRTIKYSVITGWFKFGFMKTTSSLFKKRLPITEVRELDPDETCAILFTSGGTGIPKGVLYTHKIFQTQTKILKELFNLSPEETDLPGFPLFSLFTVTMGMTSCIPDMNPAKPSQADPKKLTQNISDVEATFVAGSPAIWERVADYCLEHKMTLPSVKYLVMFGAPVSNSLHKKFSQILTNGDTYTPYGATESLPVANISGSYVLEHTASATDEGKGTCVGQPVPGIKVKIITISDEPILEFDSSIEKSTFEIGEIIVSGDVVTKEYLHMEEETKKSKIYNRANGEFWHRIGDLGYFDDLGNLWFCGRKTHRVYFQDQLLCSVQCEAIFNKNPIVRKSALVGPLGKDKSVKPTIVIELEKGTHFDRKVITEELLEASKQYPHTDSIKCVEFYDKFPVDVRHNIKIDRIKLKKIMQERMDII